MNAHGEEYINFDLLSNSSRRVEEDFSHEAGFWAAVELIDRTPQLIHSRGYFADKFSVLEIRDRRFSNLLPSTKLLLNSHLAQFVKGTSILAEEFFFLRGR